MRNYTIRYRDGIGRWSVKHWCIYCVEENKPVVKRKKKA